MNRGFDAMSAIGAGGSGGGPSPASEMAGWKTALALPPSSSYRADAAAADTKEKKRLRAELRKAQAALDLLPSDVSRSGERE